MNKIIAIIFALIPAIGYGSQHEKNYTGLYAYGPEVHSFKPCTVKKYYWVSFDWAGIEMHEYYKNFKKEPYQVMYVEFRGQILNEVIDGFALESAGLIRISEVTQYSFEVPAECK